MITLHATGVHGPGATLMPPSALLHASAIPKAKPAPLSLDVLRNTCFLCFVHCADHDQSACEVRGNDFGFVNGHLSGGRKVVRCSWFDGAFAEAGAAQKQAAIKLSTKRKRAALERARSAAARVAMAAALTGNS
jgi:hypothetical protein